MKKSLLFSSLFTLILMACQPASIEKINLPFSDEMQTQTNELIELTSYNEFVVKMTNLDTFILVVGNETCGCTLDLLPIMEDWIEETKVPVYYLEYTLLIFQDEKFEIPLVSGNTPILAIIVEGELKHYRAYNTRTSSENALFYDLDLLTAWLEERINLPRLRFLTKANFDALFETEGETLLLYIGREDCPDCSYAFQTFMIPYLLQTENVPVFYGLDVMRNGIRVPSVPGQEATTGNNTPGWEDFKTNYGLNNVLNTTFGYSTGFVPTFMIVETNGKTIAEDPSIIVDMIVVYNDSTRDSEGNYTTNVTRTFFDGTRPLQYTDLNLTEITLDPHTNSAGLRDALKPYHNEALLDFFTFYSPLITLNALGL
jgi:hypothetical protein